MSACLRRFRAAEVQVLVATDVAARGLQIDGLRYVLNWDFGSNLAQYVHRVGRTGRQGAGGTAWSFFTRNLRPLAADAVRLLRAHAQPVDPYLLQLVGGVEGAEGDEDDGGGDDDDDDCPTGGRPAPSGTPTRGSRCARRRSGAATARCRLRGSAGSCCHARTRSRWLWRVVPTRLHHRLGHLRRREQRHQLRRGLLEHSWRRAQPLHRLEQPADLGLRIDVERRDH